MAILLPGTSLPVLLIRLPLQCKRPTAAGIAILLLGISQV